MLDNDPLNPDNMTVPFAAESHEDAAQLIADDGLPVHFLWDDTRDRIHTDAHGFIIEHTCEIVAAWLGNLKLTRSQLVAVFGKDAVSVWEEQRAVEMDRAA